MEFPTKKELIDKIANDIYEASTCISWNQSQNMASKILNTIVLSLPNSIELVVTKEELFMGLDGIIKTLFKRTEAIDYSKKFYKKLLSYENKQS